MPERQQIPMSPIGRMTFAIGDVLEQAHGYWKIVKTDFRRGLMLIERVDYPSDEQKAAANRRFGMVSGLIPDPTAPRHPRVNQLVRRAKATGPL